MPSYSSYVITKTILVLSLIALVDFCVRNFSSVPDDYVETMMNAQNIIELLIIIAFLVGILPMWYEKVKNANIKNVLTFVTLAAVVLIVLFVFPEYTESSSPDDIKIIVACVLLAVLGVYYIVAYFWGKKHSKANGEENEKTSEDDPEKE